MDITEILRLDRIEEKTAFLEDSSKNILSIPSELLPKNSKSGDCFAFDGEKYVFLEKETKKRRKTLSAFIHSLINRK